MDEETRRQGRSRRFQISAVIAGSEAENLNFGVEPGAWVNEGLVDTLIPYSSATNFNSSVDAWVDPRTIDYFVNLARGSNTIIAPNMMPRQVPPEHLRPPRIGPVSGRRPAPVLLGLRRRLGTRQLRRYVERVTPAGTQRRNRELAHRWGAGFDFASSRIALAGRLEPQVPHAGLENRARFQAGAIRPSSNHAESWPLPSLNPRNVVAHHFCRSAQKDVAS